MALVAEYGVRRKKVGLAHVHADFVIDDGALNEFGAACIFCIASTVISGVVCRGQIPSRLCMACMYDSWHPYHYRKEKESGMKILWLNFGSVRCDPQSKRLIRTVCPSRLVPHTFALLAIEAPATPPDGLLLLPVLAGHCGWLGSLVASRAVLSRPDVPGLLRDLMTPRAMPCIQPLYHSTMCSPSSTSSASSPFPPISSPSSPPSHQPTPTNKSKWQPKPAI